MRVVAIVQARMGSTRLPNKVVKKIGGVPMIELLLSRLSRAKEIDQIVVATSLDVKNQSLAEHVEKLGYLCVRGSENDVLLRYLDAAHASKALIALFLVIVKGFSTNTFLPASALAIIWAACCS